MNCLFFSSISNHKFNAEEVIASSLLKTVRNRLDLVVVTGLEPRRRGLHIVRAFGSHSLRRSSFPQKTSFFGDPFIGGHRFCFNHKTKHTCQTTGVFSWWSLQDLNRVVAGFVSFAPSALIHSAAPPFPQKTSFFGDPFNGGHRFCVNHKTKHTCQTTGVFSWWSLQDLNL